MDEIEVQVCHARPDHIFLKALRVPAGTRLHEAIERSGVLQAVPGIVLDQCRTGVHGKVKPLDTVLRDRDRVEIYRPLIADPKESRRRRAVHKTAGMGR